MRGPSPRRQRLLAACVLCFAVAASGPALDLAVRPGSFVYVPVGDKAGYFTAGGGGNVGVELALPSLNLWGWWPWLSGLGGSAGLEAGYAYAPLGQNTDGGLQLYSAGGTLGLQYFLLSRLFLRADAALGLYQGVSPNATSGALWYRAGGDIGFRFSPSFVLSAGGGYGRYQNREGGPLYSGVYAGIRVQFNISMGRTGSGIGLDFAQDDVVYPSLLSLYTKAPVGTLGIVNHENAELRNVEVSFRAQDYTASEFICGTIPLLARERQEAMPLYADFSPRLMDFTENGRIAGELVFRYSYLGERRESVQSAVLQIAHRNSVPLGDPEALAALVSPTAPEILEYGKHVIGLSNTQVWSVVHKNMKSAIWLFEGLLAAGLRQEDSGSSAPSGMVEDIQYPAQTLAYRSGSAMDIGLAYAAALEASGIPSAFIFQEDDFIVLFYLNITPDAAEKTFNGTTDLIIDGDEVWMPLSMASFNEGFSKSWKAAPPRIKGEAIIMQNAWDRYPPAPFPALGVRSAMPDEQELKVRAEAALDGYIATDIQPLIDAKQKQIKEAGPGQDLAVLYNQLGILYARKGDMGAATTAYTEAAKKGSVSAANNLGNMALREKNFATARRWFEEALRLRPDNPAALQGLEKIRQRSRE